MSSKSKFDPDQYPYPECREQHVWKPFDGTIDHENKLAYRVQRCKGCPTKRHQTLSMAEGDSWGSVLKSTYVYPDDYQVKGGLSKVDRGRIRMHNFMDTIE